MIRAASVTAIAAPDALNFGLLPLGLEARFAANYEGSGSLIAGPDASVTSN
jgi:hypothetical protein